MNEKEYLRKIRKSLILIDKRKREEIVREIESEIRERLESGEKFEDILKDLPRPNEIRAEYLEIYGPSKFIISLISAGIVILSVFTIPLLPFTEIVFSPSPILLLLLAIIIVWIAANLGVKYALISSSLAGVVRIVVFYLTAMNITKPLEPGTDISVIIASVVLIILPLIKITKKE